MAKSNLNKLYDFDGYDQIGEVTRLGRVCAFFTGRTLLNSENEPVSGLGLFLPQGVDLMPEDDDLPAERKPTTEVRESYKEGYNIGRGQGRHQGGFNGFFYGFFAAAVLAGIFIPTGLWWIPPLVVVILGLTGLLLGLFSKQGQT